MAPERRPAGDVIECYKYTFGKTPGKANDYWDFESFQGQVA